METVYTVTPRILALGQEYQYSDSECEELAMDYAAMAAAALPENSSYGRRLVVAADVPDETLGEWDAWDYGSARCSTPIRWKQVASIHCDGAGTEDLVRRVSAGDEAAWEDLSALSLEWFDVSERLRIAARLEDITA